MTRMTTLKRLGLIQELAQKLAFAARIPGQFAGRRHRGFGAQPGGDGEHIAPIMTSNI